jgi:hypothetical protein
MTQEDKKLLFKDLCARLPYGVKVKCASEILTLNVNWLKVFQYHLDEIKPYLRPMPSMTEEEKKYKLSKFFRVINTNIEGVGYIPTLNSGSAIEYINWLI